MAEDDLVRRLVDFFNQYNPHSFKRKEIVLHAEDTSSYTFFLKSGFIRVYRLTEQGEELTLTILKPFDFFPFNCGTISSGGNFYLEALTQAEVWKIPQDQFLQFLKDNPEIYYKLTNTIFTRFEGLLIRMEDLVTKRAYNKVASTLLACAQKFGETKNGRVVVDLPLTHKDIAALVGITRETTCLEMKKLEKIGVISYSGRKLVIEDIKKLEEESLFLSDEDSRKYQYITL